MNPSPSSLPSLRVGTRWPWIGLGLAAWALTLLFARNPYFTEVVYSRGLFLPLRWLHDGSLGRLPLPAVYLLALFLIAWLAWRLRRARKRRLSAWLAEAAALAGGIYFLFYALWGFHYFRYPIEKQLSLGVAELSAEELGAELRWAGEALAAARAAIPGAGDSALGFAQYPASLEDSVRAASAAALRQMGYPAAGRVRCRRLPPGLLLRLGASGVYIPFAGEGHYDGALTAPAAAFTMAHEMMHAYGLGDEGSCNFAAFVACEQSGQAALQYAGRLAYWRYLASAYVARHREQADSLRSSLPPGAQADLRALRQALARHPSLFPELNRRLYDRYLRNQGIREGIASYDRMTLLTAAWRRAAR